MAKDDNNVNTITALLDSDGSTVTDVKIDPTTHILDVSDGSSGSDNSGDNAGRDGNYMPTMLAVSSSDGTTPVPLYADSNGKLLIKST